MGLIKLSSGAHWNGQSFSSSKWDWLAFIQEQVGLVKLSVGGSGIGYGIGQTFCMSKWDWSNFLQEYIGLVQLSA